MNIVAGKDLASNPVQEHIRDRVAHAVRHLPQAVRYVDVKLTSREAKKNRGRPDRKAEVNVHLAKSVGGLVRSERINYDANLYAAIDGACEAVERKLRKIKERKEDFSVTEVRFRPAGGALSGRWISGDSVKMKWKIKDFLS